MPYHWKTTSQFVEDAQKVHGDSTHFDEEFECFKKGILKVKDYLFTFLSNPLVPYDNNASEGGEEDKDKTESQRLFQNRQGGRRFCQDTLNCRNSHEEWKFQV